MAVRTGNTDEKMAIDSPDAFFGSANATAGVPGQKVADFNKHASVGFDGGELLGVELDT